MIRLVLKCFESVSKFFFFDFLCIFWLDLGQEVKPHWRKLAKMLKDSKVLGIAVACCTTNHCFTNSFWLSAGVKQHPHRHDGLRRKRCAYDSVDHGPSTCHIRVMPVMPVTVCLQISQCRFAQNDDLWDHPRIFGERGIRGIFAILSRLCHRFSKFSLGTYFQVLTNVRLQGQAASSQNPSFQMSSLLLSQQELQVVLQQDLQASVLPETKLQLPSPDNLIQLVLDLPAVWALDSHSFGCFHSLF